MPKHTDLADKIRNFLVNDLKDPDVVQVSEIDRLSNATDIQVELRNRKILTVSVFDDED